MFLMFALLFGSTPIRRNASGSTPQRANKIRIASGAIPHSPLIVAGKTALP